MVFLLAMRVLIYGTIESEVHFQQHFSSCTKPYNIEGLDSGLQPINRYKTSKVHTMFVASLLNIVSLLLVIKTTNGLQTPDIKISFPDAADKDFQDSFTSIMTNSNPIFQLICTASYPIEWIFHYSTVRL